MPQQSSTFMAAEEALCVLAAELAATNDVDAVIARAIYGRPAGRTALACLYVLAGFVVLCGRRLNVACPSV